MGRGGDVPMVFQKHPNTSLDRFPFAIIIGIPRINTTGQTLFQIQDTQGKRCRRVFPGARDAESGWFGGLAPTCCLRRTR